MKFGLCFLLPGLLAIWAHLAPAFATSGICNLPIKVGPCLAIFPRWYHNSETKKCEQFNYGGCGGNANNFSTREECERMCRGFSTTPSPGLPLPPFPGFATTITLPSKAPSQMDVCQLPRKPGSCPFSYHRWYYNSRRRLCLMFYYSGCHSNGNNFRSRKECRERCVR